METERHLHLGNHWPVELRKTDMCAHQERERKGKKETGGEKKASHCLIAPAIISAFVHMVSLPGKSHYPAVPLFYFFSFFSFFLPFIPPPPPRRYSCSRRFPQVECDFGASIQRGVLMPSNTIKSRVLMMWVWNGYASGYTKTHELWLQSAILSLPAPTSPAHPSPAQFNPTAEPSTAHPAWPLSCGPFCSGQRKVIK